MRAIFLLFACSLLATSGHAAEILVRPDGTGDVPTIADAIAAAGANDVVVLADGSFSGPGNRDLVLPARSVQVRSASGDAAACVIELESFGGFLQDADYPLQLDNISICRGLRADGGGGVDINRGSLTARGCRFIANGGGGDGAAIYCRNAHALLEDCEVASSIGSLVYAVYLASGTVRRCNFHDHEGQLAAACYFESSGLVQDCVFRANRIRGTALHCWYGGDLQVDRTLFIDNESQFGGAISLDNTNATVRGCTFLRNLGAVAGGITFATTDDRDRLVIDRCLFAADRSPWPVFAEPAGAVRITCTDMHTAGRGWHPMIAGQLSSSGNMDVVPMICDPVGGDLRVADISPCLPQNNACHVLIGVFGQGCVGEGYLVRPDGSGAIADIQTALDIVPAGGTVLLADGVFTGPRNANLDCRGKPLTLRSLSGHAEDCVIDAGEGERVMRFHTGEGAATVIRDLTMRGGSGTLNGGGVLVDGAAPWFFDCRFESGQAHLGGGLAVTNDSWPVLHRCVFVGNTSGVGGAVWVSGAHADLFSCTIAGNSSSVAACYVQEGALRLEQTIVAHNEGGPALMLFTNGTAYLAACDLFGNEGGDWTTPIAEQRDLRDNFQAPPCFCDLPSGVLTLCADSWCLAEHNPLGNGLPVGALGLGCDGCGCGGPVETQDDGTDTVPAPLAFGIAASPNPFNPATTIIYRLDEAGPATLAVYDLRGRRVVTLLQASLPAGEGRVTWNGRDDAGRMLEAGAYVCRLETPTGVRTITVSLLK